MSPGARVSVDQSEVVDLFVDGTAAHPQEPRLRYAAWAVTLTRLGSLDNTVILGGHVQGLCQSPFRAELRAMLAALLWAKQQGVRARIWTDCQAVLRGFLKLQRGGVVKRNRPHSDLWLQVAAVFDSWDRDFVSVHKVVSHGLISEATGPMEEWADWHNGLTDRAAAQINDTRQQGFWTAWDGMARALAFNRKLHRAILLVLLKSGRKAHGRAEESSGSCTLT